MIKRLAMLAVLLAVAATLPFSVSAAPGGNSANAKLCQKGGWETLATSEDPHIAFTNQGACVSYGAQGGVITAVVPYNPSIQVTLSPTGDSNYCIGYITGTDFPPNTSYPYSTYMNGNLYTSGATVTSDASGNFGFYGWSYYRGAQVTFQAQIGDLYTNVITLDGC